jgi:endonuclease/exonuclease/phosphatase family metal-dependent hydrolase
MNTLRFFTFLLSICTVTHAFGQSKKNNGPTSLKVMTYNIHHGNPPSHAEGFIDLPAIARVINDAAVDLVALQEVDVNTERSGKGIHQAKELARLTGMYYFFSKAIDHQGGDYGVAVLSKFPIIGSLRLPLPLPDGVKGEPRTLAAIKVKVGTKKNIWFASTHLDLKSETRLFQSDLIVKRFAKSKHPLILAGDFNAKPDSREIAFLDKTFTRTCILDCQPTSPNINPRNTIDYIMFTHPKKIRSTNTSVIHETYASDHLPVVADLTID